FHCVGASTHAQQQRKKNCSHDGHLPGQVASIVSGLAMTAALNTYSRCRRRVGRPTMRGRHSSGAARHLLPPTGEGGGQTPVSPRGWSEHHLFAFPFPCLRGKVPKADGGTRRCGRPSSGAMRHISLKGGRRPACGRRVM